MVRCSYCGRETELYQCDVPTCVGCSAELKVPKSGVGRRNVHSLLRQDHLDAIVRLEDIVAIHRQLLQDIPGALPHPDGVQRIYSISQQLTSAKERFSRAQSRLTDFLDNGTIPEDLAK